MDIYEEIVELRREGRRGAVATIVNVRGSIPSFRTAKMLVRDDGSIVGTIGGGCVEADVWQAAREVMESEKPRTLKFDLNQDPKYDTGLVCGGTLEVRSLHGLVFRHGRVHLPAVRQLGVGRRVAG